MELTQQSGVIVDNQDKISQIMAKIDEESETPELISGLISELIPLDSTDTNSKKQHLFSLIRSGIRYSCFLDKYHETGENIYIEEALRQRDFIFNSIPPENRYMLENVEKNIMPFWEYEKEIQRRIENDNVFKEEEIKKYLNFRASDSFFYCALAELFIPFSPEMKRLFHNRLMLSDIVDSIKDYEEDLGNRHPNMLIMYLLNYISVDEMPASLQQALNLACQFKINSRIQKFGRELYYQSLKSEHMDSMPLLKKDFDTKYFIISELL